jgi:Bifunctional DNA primase/polymerase, N-terminal/Primase C terminal 2 (PriCT-2)/Family of unknown function (DUF5906)
VSFREYVEGGWKLCAIHPKSKGPTYDNWNTQPIDADIAEVSRGAGLLHSLSGTCSLDIDNLELARPWLAERGIDLDALLEAPNAVKITSGTPNRAKLLYRLKVPLRTIKPKGSGVELRCATIAGDSTQDVLPPSIHPSGRTYEWEFGEPLLGDWRKLPPIPAALKATWKTLIDEAPPEKSKANGHDKSHDALPNPALDKLERWIAGQNPNADYDDWLKVGMKLHDATGGAEEGLALWDAWSATGTRKRFSNGAPVYAKGTCRLHWVSFSSPPGKHVAKLDNEMPAEADEFEEIPVEASPGETKAIAQTLKDRKEAIAKLEARLVYVVNEERYFDMTRHRLVGSDSAIEHMFTPLMPLRKGGRMNPVKILKNSTTKRTVEALGFHPGEGALFKVGDDTYANGYRNRLPEPIKPSDEDAKRIDWLFERIEDGDYRHWLKQFYGHVVQKPGVKIKSAPLLWSDIQRNGKTTILKAVPALLVGQEYSTDVSYDLLSSNFNDYLQGAWHVNLTEFRAGTRGERTMINNKIKAFITDDMIPFHAKGRKGGSLPNHFFMTASSNEDDAAAIDNTDERWGIYEFKQPKFTHAERDWIYYEFLLQPRAAAVLRYYFLNYDLKGFQPAGSAPMTDSKQEMADASMASDEELLKIMFEERAEFFARDVVLTSEVHEYVHKHCTGKPSSTRIGKILCRKQFGGESIRFRDGAGSYRAIVLRNHAKWKAAPGRKIMEHIRSDDDVDLLQ